MRASYSIGRIGAEGAESQESISMEGTCKSASVEVGCVVIVPAVGGEVLKGWELS